MFGYFLHRQRFVIALGQFVSRNVISYYDPACGRVYRTVGALNSLDRRIVARDFWSTLHPNVVEGGIDVVTMLDEIAVYIDRQIPKAYYKYHAKLDGAPSTHTVRASDYGLIYHYAENQVE